jgi:hypothetical protein
MNQRSWIIITVGVAVVIGASAYGLSPFLAFKQLRDAAKSGDRDRLEEVVDFPAVRENLKSQFTAGLVRSIGADPKMHGNPFAAVGALLVPAITDRIVDSIVTPDGIAAMLSQGKVSKPGGEPISESTAANDPPDLETALSYRTLNRFHAELRRRDQPDTTLALTLERRGWFGWRLIRIDIPDSLFRPDSSASNSTEAELDPDGNLALVRAKDTKAAGQIDAHCKKIIRAADGSLQIGKLCLRIPRECREPTIAC